MTPNKTLLDAAFDPELAKPLEEKKDKSFFKIIADSFRKDWEILKAIREGHAELRLKPRDAIKLIPRFFKEYYWLIFLFIIIFLLGMLVSAGYYSHKANAHINDFMERFNQKYPSIPTQEVSWNLTTSTTINIQPS